MLANLDIYYPNGGTLANQMFIWDGSKPILWDGSVTFSGSLPSTVAGNKSNNAAAPTNDNLGALTAVANASAPAYTEGRQVLLSTDLSGSLRVAATISTAGLATSAKQDIGNVSLADIDTSNAAILTALGLITNKLTPYFYISTGASNQDSQVVKNAAGILGFISVFSTIAGARFLKIYNKSTGPTSSDTPVYVAAIPNNTTGAGSNLSIPQGGLNFSSGISIRITTGAANNDTGACSTNDVFVNLGYT